MAKYIVGVDIGGTKILAALALRNGKIIKTISLPTQAEKGKAVSLNNVKKAIRMVLSQTKTPLSRISAIGVGAPGPMLYKQGIIINPPNLPGWKKVNLRKILQREFRKPVFIDNDANAAALAEFRFGAGRGTKNMVYLTISTGIGGGIIIDKKLYRGGIGGAGEIGHMIIQINGPKCGCGNRGCLEALASGKAMAELARELVKINKRSLIYKLAEGKIKKITAITIEKASKARDRLALSIINEIGRRLGTGIANIINILEPDKVVIGGGLSSIGKPLFTSIRKTAKELSLEPGRSSTKIVPAKFKREAGIRGAVALCLDGSF